MQICMNKSCMWNCSSPHCRFNSKPSRLVLLTETPGMPSKTLDIMEWQVCCVSELSFVLLRTNKRISQWDNCSHVHMNLAWNCGFPVQNDRFCWGRLLPIILEWQDVVFRIDFCSALRFSIAMCGQLQPNVLCPLCDRWTVKNCAKLRLAPCSALILEYFKTRWFIMRLFPSFWAKKRRGFSCAMFEEWTMNKKARSVPCSQVHPPTVVYSSRISSISHRSAIRTRKCFRVGDPWSSLKVHCASKPPCAFPTIWQSVTGERVFSRHGLPACFVRRHQFRVLWRVRAHPAQNGRRGAEQGDRLVPRHLPRRLRRGAGAAGRRLPRRRRQGDLAVTDLQARSWWVDFDLSATCQILRRRCMAVSGVMFWNKITHRLRLVEIFCTCGTPVLKQSELPVACAET